MYIDINDQTPRNSQTHINVFSYQLNDTKI